MTTLFGAPLACKAVCEMEVGVGESLKNVLSVLRSTPRRWIHLADTIPPDLFKRSPAPGEWSAYECLRHLVDTERMVFPARVEYLLRGEDFPAFDPDAEGEKRKGDASLHDLSREFERLRSKSIRLLSHVRSEELGRTARHQELGMVSLGEMVNQWAGHDLMHTVQGERAIMQVFIDGCGPWKKYFSDHLIG
ncbi:MAG: hypothetical protein C3F14_00525 [Deltaproteobacteria bacterium]|nr:MAG: hypothetical protein C3F14_00525 [Deltaproteobacteria bacterium]